MFPFSLSAFGVMPAVSEHMAVCEQAEASAEVLVTIVAVDVDVVVVVAEEMGRWRMCPAFAAVDADQGLCG